MEYQLDPKTREVMRQIDELDAYAVMIETEQGTFRRLHLGELLGDRWVLDVTDVAYSEVAA